MKIPRHPHLHLTYCLNVHPGETLAEQIAAIRTTSLSIRDRVPPGQPFGLGLRLGASAADELTQSATRHHFREFLNQNNLYVFTVNGFPYGRFHNSRVKEKVAKPDWRSTQRRDYTLKLIRILADLLPAGMDGSISTVPGSFKSWITQPSDMELMVRNLMDCVITLSRLRQESGVEIHLGLEPEPDFFVESAVECVKFLKEMIFIQGRDYLASRLGSKPTNAESIIRRHLGICLDTCHESVLFAEPLNALRLCRSEGIRLSKIHLTAAPSVTKGDFKTIFTSFCDKTYLHQTVARLPDGRLRRWPDLPAVMDEMDDLIHANSRVHFHIPLSFTGDGPLGTTAAELTPELFSFLKEEITHHLEIETYTFQVLPPDWRTDNLAETFQREYRWVLAKL